jgi:hypothetical protein
MDGFILVNDIQASHHQMAIPNSSWRWTKYQDAEACINKVPLLAIGCVRNERLACYDHFWVGGENDVLNTRDFMVLNTRRKFGSQTSDNMDR